MRLSIRPYEPARHGNALFALWSRSIAQAWPVARRDFDAIVTEGQVAVDAGRIVGIAAVGRSEGLASLQLLLVDPEVRGRGIGRALAETTLNDLARDAVQEVRLGGTPGRYFWPGLPAELIEARGFLERSGWKFGDPCWDLVQSLAEYETPADVSTQASNMTCGWAAEADRQALLEFERRNFPQWADAFAADETMERSLIAVDPGGAIVGSLLACDTSRPQLWRQLLGDDSGSINAVGVDETVQGRGIGTALVAYACEQLRDRGVANCHVGWTTRLSFYGRVGFRTWRRFETARLRLQS